MFDFISSEAMKILSITIGGVSIGAILALAIYVITQIRANRKAINVTKGSITEAFKDAVLPKNIRLDVSNKIEKPIKDGLRNISEVLIPYINKLNEGNKLILKILTEFSHVKKLSDEDREAIKDYLEDDTPVDIEV